MVLYDDEQRRIRRDTIRRANLYGVSSKRRFPTVHLPSTDVRVRKELQLLSPYCDVGQTPNTDGYEHSVYEHEVEKHKHHEHLGLRPALDQSHPLRDLYTTVPKKLVADEESSKPHEREWRVGYSNHSQSDWHGKGLDGLFEPSDSMREHMVTNYSQYAQYSTAITYPVPAFMGPADIRKEMQPFDELQDHIDTTAPYNDNQDAVAHKTKKVGHWCPASTVKPKPKKSKSITQKYPLRVVTSPRNKTPLQVDERYVQKKQAQVHQAQQQYLEIHEHFELLKDPTTRYKLPIDDSAQVRSYRLGLDAMPSANMDDSFENTKPPRPRNGKAKLKTSMTRSASSSLLFRPKSAVSLQIHTTISPCLSSSRSSSTLLQGQETGKVGGAKRRPHTASVTYLPHSTVYCMDPPSDTTNPPSPSRSFNHLKEQEHYGPEFHTVLSKERRKRQTLQESTFLSMEKRGLFTGVPLPQVFARLRREALKNLVHRIEYIKYEKLSMEEYMLLCGLVVISDGDPSFPQHVDVVANSGMEMEKDCMTPVPQVEEEEDHGMILEFTYLQLGEPQARKKAALQRALSRPPESINGNNSSTLITMRKALYVTREQFHIALDTFLLALNDLNQLYSALDVEVADHVELWSIIQVIERLQHGHEQVRKSKAPPKAPI